MNFKPFDIHLIWNFPPFSWSFLSTLFKYVPKCGAAHAGKNGIGRKLELDHSNLTGNIIMILPVLLIINSCLFGASQATGYSFASKGRNKKSGIFVCIFLCIPPLNLSHNLRTSRRVFIVKRVQNMSVFTRRAKKFAIKLYGTETKNYLYTL